MNEDEERSELLRQIAERDAEIRDKCRRLLETMSGHDPSERIGGRDPAVVAIEYLKDVVASGDRIDNQIASWGAFLRHLRPLSEGEFAGVAPLTPKTASLFFDRVWSPFAPEDLQFSGGTLAEAQAITVAFSRTYQDAINLVAGSSWYKQALQTHALSDLRKLADGTTDGWRLLSRAINTSLQKPIPVIYPWEAGRRSNYEAGDSEVAIAALVGLELVDETSLEWAQVVEFRKDKNSVRSFRRLLHWLDAELVGKSPLFLQEWLERRLEEYRSTLRIHGIRTKQGILETMVDEKTLLSGAASAAIGAATAGQLWAALAGLSTVLAKVGLRIWKDRVELLELKAKHPEIAFVHEIERKLGPGQAT